MAETTIYALWGKERSMFEADYWMIAAYESKEQAEKDRDLAQAQADATPLMDPFSNESTEVGLALVEKEQAHIAATWTIDTNGWFNSFHGNAYYIQKMRYIPKE